MLLIKFLNNLFKQDGFLLEDANEKEHIIGKPKLENPIKKQENLERPKKNKENH